MVWESTPTTRETHNNEAANLSGTEFFPTKLNHTIELQKATDCFKWDALIRAQKYVLICLSRFLTQKPWFLHFQSSSSCLQLSHSQRSRTLQHIQWCPPLRYEILQWGGGRTCTPKKHGQTAKLRKVQQHLIKSSSFWTSSANKNLEMMLLVMVIHEVLQLPTPPKKRGKFLWEPPWFLTPNLFFISTPTNHRPKVRELRHTHVDQVKPP